MPLTAKKKDLNPTLSLKELRYITSEDGKPNAVIISLEDFKRMMETLEIMSDRELTASINRARVELRKGRRLLSHREVFGDL